MDVFKKNLKSPNSKENKVFNILEEIRGNYHPEHGLIENVKKSMMNMSESSIESLAFLLHCVDLDNNNKYNELKQSHTEAVELLDNIHAEVRPEISRVNETAGCTIFNPVATETVDQIMTITSGRKVKYYIIDLWNGEGYSEPCIQERFFKNDLEAHAHCMVMASQYTEGEREGTIEDLMDDRTAESEWFKVSPETAKVDFRYSPSGYSYTIGDDAGSCHWVRANDIVGIVCKPQINEYEAVYNLTTWAERQSELMANSEEYKSGDAELFDYHHEVEGGDIDWQLFQFYSISGQYEGEV